MMLHKEGKWFKWIILSAGFYVNTFVFTTVFSFGSLFNDMLEKFHDNVSRTATVHAIFKASGLTLGIFTGLLISRFGMRKVSLIGGIMAPLGFILSFMATSILHLYFSIGIIAGIGTSIIAISATTAVNHSFSGSQRLLVLSVQNMGMSVGGALTPYLFDHFVKQYGLNGNFLLMGGLYLNCLPAAILFSITRQQKMKKKDNEPQTKGNVDSETHMKLTSKTCISILETEIKRLKKDIHKIMRPPFILTALGMGFAMAPIGGVNSLILDILKWKGFTSSEALLAFSVSSGVGIIVRLIPGIAKQFKRVSCFVCPIIFSLCGACAQLIFLFFSDNIILLVGCGFMGVAIAGLASGVNIVVAQLVDQEQISVGIGLIYSTLGILSTVYGPTYGAIRDAFQSYDIVLYMAFGFELLGTALFLVTVFARRLQPKNPEETTNGQDNYTFNNTEH